MTLHHDKHHATYVNGLNAAEEKLAGLQSSQDVKGQIGLQAALKFNGGGHINHSVSVWRRRDGVRQRGSKGSFELAARVWSSSSYLVQLELSFQRHRRPELAQLMYSSSLSPLSLVAPPALVTLLALSLTPALLEEPCAHRLEPDAGAHLRPARRAGQEGLWQL